MSDSGVSQKKKKKKAIIIGACGYGFVWLSGVSSDKHTSLEMLGILKTLYSFSFLLLLVAL